MIDNDDSLSVVFEVSYSLNGGTAPSNCFNESFPNNGVIRPVGYPTDRPKWEFDPTPFS